MRLARLAVGAALLGAMHAALAQSAPAVQAAPAASPTSSLLQGVLGLAIVVGLIFAAGWVLKKVGPRGTSTNAVRVLGGASVGPRERVVVVQFGDQTLLLGVASGRVNLLHAALPGEVAAAPTDPASAPRFIDRLRAARGQS
jgi:flagellar protein FliO/FliZ